MELKNKVQKIDKKRALTAIFFDIDNTLIKTKETAKKADMSAMRVFALNVKSSPEFLYEQWKEIVDKLKESKNPLKRTRKYSYAQLSNNLNINKGIYKKAYNAFIQTLVYFIQPMNNISEIIPKLKSYKLAAITEDSRETAIAKLKNTKLYNNFDFIIASDDIGFMKPHKDYFLKIFKEFEVSPQECLVIGDNYEKDLEIAQKFGCITVCFGQDKRADYQINDFYELLEILKDV